MRIRCQKRTCPLPIRYPLSASDGARGAALHVVDQPGAAEPCRGQHDDVDILSLRSPECAGHAHLEVIGAEAGGAQRLEAFVLDGCDVAVTPFEAAPCAIERAINGGCLGAFFGTQVAVARTEREAVVRAHRRRPDDLHRQAEVFHRAADDRELLVVLLAEDADVGLHEVQQLHDHSGDALEVAGTERAAEDAGDISSTVRRNSTSTPWAPSSAESSSGVRAYAW